MWNHALDTPSDSKHLHGAAREACDRACAHRRDFEGHDGLQELGGGLWESRNGWVRISIVVVACAVFVMVVVVVLVPVVVAGAMDNH